MLWFFACARLSPEPVAPAALLPLPSGPGASTPALVEDGEALLLTWQVKAEEGGALWFSRFDDEGWSAPVELVSDPALLVNWADYPSAVRGGDGALYTHWLRREEGGPYAYDPVVLRSEDGLEWTELGTLNSDEEPAEHGFVSWVPSPSGARATWLDGRGMAEGEPMSLRAAQVGTRIYDEVVVDDRVCDCCRTDAAGDLVVYRDRSPTEIRDISVARPGEEGWATAPLSVDRWQIAGCPVNGPDVEVDGQRAVTAWFTAADEPARVRVAFAEDGWGFGEAVDVAPGPDEPAPLGRVALEPEGEGAVVIWLASIGEDNAAVSGRRVTLDGAVGPTVEIGFTAASRKAGFPSLARHGEDLLVAWTVPGQGLEARRLSVADFPPAVAPLQLGGAGGGPPPTLPALELTTLEGEALSVPQGGVLIALWATWCGPCREELPQLQALHDAGVPVLGISVDDPDRTEAVAAYVEELGLSFPVAHAFELAERFGTNAIPATYVYDAEGALLWHRIEAFDPEDPALLQALSEL